MDLLCFCSVLCLLCICACLFICALWSPAGQGLTSWLSFVVSNCDFLTFQLVSWADLGPNTLKSIQIHYSYFDLSMITITLQLQDL